MKKTGRKSASVVLKVALGVILGTVLANMISYLLCGEFHPACFIGSAMGIAAGILWDEEKKTEADESAVILPETHPSDGGNVD